jgi:chromosome segregation ATPase
MSSAWTNARLRLAAASVCAALGAASAAHGEDNAARLRLDALIQEGELLLTEARSLEPAAKQIRQQGQQLSATEAALTAEWNQIEQDIAQYNAELNTLVQDAGRHRELCPGSNTDDKLLEECNGNAIALTERSRALERRRDELQERRAALNQHVERHQAALAQWKALRREHAPRTEANAADTRRWLGSTRSFVVTEEFAAFAKQAGTQAPCTDVPVPEGDFNTVVSGLKQVQTCLKSVRTAIR